MASQQQAKSSNECQSEEGLPFPRSSGSAWTTTARPMMGFGPVRGICDENKLESLRKGSFARKREYEKKIYK